MGYKPFGVVGLRNRREFFHQGIRHVPSVMHLNLFVRPGEVHQIATAVTRSQGLPLTQPAETVREQELVRRLFDARMVFPYVLPATFVTYPECLVILEAPAPHLVPGWSRRPEELDVLAVPLVNGRPEWQFIASIEVKKLVVRGDGELADGVSTGTGQALGLLEFGVDTVFLIHLVIQSPRFGEDDVCQIHDSGPKRAAHERLRWKRQIQSLEDTRAGYAILGFGQLPGVDFGQLSQLDVDGTAPVPIEVEGNSVLRRRRQALVERLRGLYFSAAQEADFDVTSTAPLFLFRGRDRWRLSQTALDGPVDG